MTEKVRKFRQTYLDFLNQLGSIKKDDGGEKVLRVATFQITETTHFVGLADSL